MDNTIQLSHTYQVLVVDDIPENLQVLSNILYEEGIEISFATNGKQALDTMTFVKPDLILLDISMPEMDGYEVCRRLKANPETAHIPIIFLTARTQTDDIIKGFEVGAVDYVTKPFNSNELVSRVFTHLELKHSRDVIKKQNEELITLNATKDKFFSIIAHDLKNPFNTLIGFSDLMLQGYDRMDREKIMKFLNLIHLASKRGFNLLENLLEWSRSQTGAIQCKPESLNIAALLSSFEDMLKSTAASKNIELVYAIPSYLTAYADANMLKTVMRNLISNAIKFSPTDSQIYVLAEQNEKWVDISVEDRGVGISENDLEKLFRIDIHHSTKGTSDEQGTGLGLILCKEFVERNGGKISVKSRVGEGSTFKVVLPAEKIDNE